jgi:hypothetical protein
MIILLIFGLSLIYFYFKIKLLEDEIIILKDTLKGVVKLKPHEHLKIVNIKFGKDFELYKDSGEPIDSLAILTYSNVEKK